MKRSWLIELCCLIMEVRGHCVKSVSTQTYKDWDWSFDQCFTCGIIRHHRWVRCGRCLRTFSDVYQCPGWGQHSSAVTVWCFGPYEHIPSAPAGCSLNTLVDQRLWTVPRLECVTEWCICPATDWISVFCLTEPSEESSTFVTQNMAKWHVCMDGLMDDDKYSTNKRLYSVKCT